MYDARMHLLFVLPLIVVFSFVDVSAAVRTIVYSAFVLLWLPDMILAVRKNPPYVPTFGRDIKTMLHLAAIKKGEKMYDPGCGDGRLVFAAAKEGAHAIGYEYSLPMFLYSWTKSWLHPGSTILLRDMWKQDYTDADIILCYLLPEVMEKFTAVIWPQLKPGTRVISHAFRMKQIEPVKSEKGIYVYIK